MVSVVFSYDTEEYQAPFTDLATKTWADLLTKHGLRGCFCTVGEKARVLRDRGRRDIIDALKPHEIDYHSDLHSVHPTHAEYLNELNWDDGVQRCLMEETPGIADVERILGERPIAYCKPGSSWGPQVVYSMSIMGLPVFADAPIEFAPGQPMWFCNQLCLKYHTSFERSMEVENRFEHIKSGFLELYSSRKDGYVVMYSHPCRMVASAFGDGLNFKDGKNTPKEEWLPVPKRPDEDIKAIRDAADHFLEFVAGEGIPVVTYREIYEKYREDNLWVSLETALNVLKSVAGELTYHWADGIYLSPAEIFGLALFILDAYNRSRVLPATIPIQRPIGPTEDCHSQSPITVSAEAFLNTASQVHQTVHSAHRVPSVIHFGNAQVAPGCFLKAASEFIRALHTHPEPPQTVMIKSAQNTPTLAKRQDFKQMRIGGWLMAPDFEADNVVAMAKRQTWTAKPGVAMN
jgi:hypothetical protein